MLAAIALNNDLAFNAHEVCNVISDWDLSSKFKITQSAGAQTPPQ
jgi:hypothetical protein